MRDSKLEEQYPKLRSGGYCIKSEYDPKYNCIAFVVGNPTRNWQWMPHRTGGYYWPPDIQGDDSIESWTRVFHLHGYRRCDTGSFEPETEKVVIYMDFDGTPTHVAKQDIETGKWVSKLGKDYDIEHDAFEILEGDEGHEYGTAVRFMKRPLTTRSAWG